MINELTVGVSISNKELVGASVAIIEEASIFTTCRGRCRWRLNWNGSGIRTGVGSWLKGGLLSGSSEVRKRKRVELFVRK